MFCKKCGKEINDTKRFCPSCGEKNFNFKEDKTEMYKEKGVGGAVLKVEFSQPLFKTILKIGCAILAIIGAISILSGREEKSQPTSISSNKEEKTVSDNKEAEENETEDSVEESEISSESDIVNLYQNLGMVEDENGYNISNKAMAFLEEHEDLFPARKEIDMYDTSLIDLNFDVRLMEKNQENAGDKLIVKEDLYVVQINENDIDKDKKFTVLLLGDEIEGTIYTVYYNGEVKDVFSEDYVDMVGLPIAYTSYTTLEQVDQMTVIIAGSTVVKK